jgi:hypothetical protein
VALGLRRRDDDDDDVSGSRGDSVDAVVSSNAAAAAAAAVVDDDDDDGRCRACRCRRTRLARALPIVSATNTQYHTAKKQLVFFYLLNGNGGTFTAKYNGFG